MRRILLCAILSFSLAVISACVGTTNKTPTPPSIPEIPTLAFPTVDSSLATPLRPADEPAGRASFSPTPRRLTPTKARSTVTSRTRTPTRGVQVNGFQTISASELPKEARDTLALIERGGTFPYRQDGVVFQNREGFLPNQPRGYYHEYTVKTPGESDRGARRIITGAQGELYYTDDHYQSFKVILTNE